MEYVVITVIVVVVALAIRRMSDPGRLERKRYERLKELGESMSEDKK